VGNFKIADNDAIEFWHTNTHEALSTHYRTSLIGNL